MILLLLCLSLGVYWLWVDRFSQKVLTINNVGAIGVKQADKEDLVGVFDEYQKKKIVKILLPQGSEFVYSLEDLGISIDIGDLWYQRNNPKYLFWNYSPKLRASLGKIEIRVGDESSVSAIFDNETGLFVVSGNQKIFQMPIGEVINEIRSGYGDSSMVLAPSFEIISDASGKYKELNDSLANIYKEKVIVRVKDGSGYTDFVLPNEVLRKALDVEKIKLGEIVLEREVIMDYLSQRLTNTQKQDFNQDIAYNNVSNEIKKRFMAGESGGVVLGIDDGPTSDGGLANKYLEVDISQQKMYFFEEGKLFKEYKISTGAYYPTPVGRFHIMNKANNAYSDIFGVWMPYWMAFDYAEDIGAYLGIHELPYVAGESGRRIYRFGYYIGRKMTGGCVAMEPKDSKEVFSKSDVGMLVNIVP